MSPGCLVIFVHGGPGGGCSEQDRGFFNPEKWKVIFLDQRGAGKSTPYVPAILLLEVNEVFLISFTYEGAQILRRTRHGIW